MINFNSARDEIAKILKLNQKMRKKFSFLIDKSIRNYIKKDCPDDIEQNIYAGIIGFLNYEKIDLNYDLITARVIKRKKRLEINDKKIIRIIIVEYNIIRIKNKQQMKFLIEDITSSHYGIREGKRTDILKMSFKKKESYYEEVQEYRDSDLKDLGIYDPDSEVDIEMKFFVDKYYQSLDDEEKEIFTRYFYQDTSFIDMLEMNYVRNEYVLKKFIKKTKRYFYEQLVG